MDVDCIGNIGVTADPQKVRPGMIFVDLEGRRNKKRIYEAYMNGAYLIFTAHNILDPELPVIKVRNPQETLYKMFDRLHGMQEQQTKLVAVFGESDKRVLLELIQGILKPLGDRDAGNRGDEVGDTVPVTIDASISNLFYIGNVGIDCAILTDSGYVEGSRGNRMSADCISGLMEKKTIIVNNDEAYAIKAAGACKEATLISYGLNKKAVVTASSIDVEEIICFNYCVQRSFRTRSGKIVEPFEIPIRLNALGSQNIYNALAAITCGLYYDIDPESIKASIESYRAPARRFQKIYDGEYSIIDNYCGSIYDYNAAFESMQMLNYENLILIISLSQNMGISLHAEKARLIAEWAKMLKCKEVIFTSCMDGDSLIGELPLKGMRIYRTVFRESEIPFKYYHLVKHAIVRGVSLLNKKDLLMMLGSDEMNSAHNLLYRYKNYSNSAYKQH